MKSSTRTGNVTENYKFLTQPPGVNDPRISASMLRKDVQQCYYERGEKSLANGWSLPHSILNTRKSIFIELVSDTASLPWLLSFCLSLPLSIDFNYKHLRSTRRRITNSKLNGCSSRLTTYSTHTTRHAENSSFSLIPKGC